MGPKKIEATRVDYPKHWFALGSIIYAILTVTLLYLGLDAKEDFGSAFWFVVAAVEGVLLFLFLVPSLLTTHLAGEKALRIHMGVLVDVSIPYAWINEVKETSVHRGGLRVGVGVRYSPIPQILFVTSSFNGLVTMKLDGEHLMGRFLKRPVQEVVVSVVNAARLVEIVKDRGRTKG